MSTATPKTSKLYHLAEQIVPVEELAQAWADEYMAAQANNLSLKWGEEFSGLSLSGQEESETEYVTFKRVVLTVR